jgi:hypothetical protein
MIRECGECRICCYIGGVEALDKPAHAICPHLTGRGCAIHGQAQRPHVCSAYECLWKRGAGAEHDRPDKCRVMLSISKINGGIWIFAIELSPGAIRGPGRRMVLAAAERVDVPVIVVSHGILPPHDTGDLTVVKDSLLHRCQGMIGDALADLADGFKVYRLRSAA